MDSFDESCLRRGPQICDIVREICDKAPARTQSRARSATFAYGGLRVHYGIGGTSHRRREVLPAQSPWPM